MRSFVRLWDNHFRNVCIEHFQLPSGLNEAHLCLAALPDESDLAPAHLQVAVELDLLSLGMGLESWTTEVLNRLFPRQRSPFDLPQWHSLRFPACEFRAPGSGP